MDSVGLSNLQRDYKGMEKGLKVSYQAAGAEHILLWEG
jgi:hypothetical protein